MRRLGILAFAIAAIGFTKAEATPIYFTHQGTATVTIGSGDPVVLDYRIEARGQIESRQSLSGGSVLSIEHEYATIFTPGVGPGEFFYIVSPTRTLVDVITGAVAFARGGDAGSSLITSSADLAYQTWTMDTSIGPVAGTATYDTWDDAPPIEVILAGEGGVMRFAPTTTAPYSLTATVVPEPASCLLAGGLIAISFFARPVVRAKRALAETIV
ncbi:MAG: hypothetical protein C0485_05165 [Pirellula sp.]|nr:hypothetical protein [Pirellula sp.]